MAFFLPKYRAEKETHKSSYAELASVEKRLYACASDLLLIVFILILFHQLQFLLVAQFFYFFFSWWKCNGTTIGNRLFHIRVVTLDKRSLPMKQSVLRAGGFLLSEISLLGFVWILIDKKKQGWHDKLAKTIVISTV